MMDKYRWTFGDYLEVAWKVVAFLLVGGLVFGSCISLLGS